MSDVENAEVLANEAEQIFTGQPTATVLYAIGMLIAHAISMGEQRDVDATMKILGSVVRLELDRQF